MGAETTYQYSTEHYVPCGSEIGTQKKMINNYVIKEKPDDSGLLYQYEYIYPSYECYNGEAFPRSITTIEGPNDDNNKYTKTEFEYFTLQLNGFGGLEYNDFVSGKEAVSRTYGCDASVCGADKLKKETNTSYDAFDNSWGFGKWLGTFIDLEDGWGQTYCTDVHNVHSQAECTPANCGMAAGVTFWLNNYCYGSLYTTISYPTGSTTKIKEGTEEKKYAQASSFDKYLNPTSSTNYGEVSSYTWYNNGFPYFVPNSNPQSDDVSTTTTYYYETYPAFEGAGGTIANLYNYFVHLPKLVETEDPTTHAVLSSTDYTLYNPQ